MDCYLDCLSSHVETTAEIWGAQQVWESCSLAHRRRSQAGVQWQNRSARKQGSMCAGWSKAHLCLKVRRSLPQVQMLRCGLLVGMLTPWQRKLPIVCCAPWLHGCTTCGRPSPAQGHRHLPACVPGVMCPFSEAKQLRNPHWSAAAGKCLSSHRALYSTSP